MDKPLEPPFAEIGARLTNLRLAIGKSQGMNRAISQAALCRKTGIKPSRWNQYEKGHREITKKALALLDEHYSVSFDWVLKGDVGGMPARLADQLPLAAE